METAGKMPPSFDPLDVGRESSRGWYRAGGRKALPWPCLHDSVPVTGGESY